MRNETSATDSKKALLDAFDQVLKTQAETREAERLATEQRRRARSRIRPVPWVALLVLVVAAAYVWVERPEWLFPPPPPVESVAVREASLRIAVANAVQHIERFRQQTGRLPTTLEEAGAYPDGIVYLMRGGADYQIRGASGTVQVLYRSHESLPDFLGESFQIISRRSL